MFDLPEFGGGLVVYLGIFLGVLMAFDGIWQLLSRTERVRDARNRRMRMIARGATPGEVLTLLKPVEARWSLSALPLFGSLPGDLRKAGLSISPVTVIAGSAVLTLLVGGMLMARLPVGPAFGLGAVIGFLGPIILIRTRKRQRMQLLVQQLPDALDLMARGLKVGHPLNTTITTVARDMVDPVASEFGIIVDQVAFGEDLVTAFRDFAERTDLEDTRYLATSVAIQNGTGSDLSRILLTLSKVIRGRITMRKRILAISAEGRMTAVFMSLLPLFIFGMTMITSPSYYGDVSDDPLFNPIAIAVIIAIIANYLAMRRLVNFRI